MLRGRCRVPVHINHSCIIVGATCRAIGAEAVDAVLGDLARGLRGDDPVENPKVLVFLHMVIVKQPIPRILANADVRRRITATAFLDIVINISDDLMLGVGHDGRSEYCLDGQNSSPLPRTLVGGVGGTARRCRPR